MKSVCLFFHIHQPFRHRRYRFFDIGRDHYYYDDYTNESVVRNISAKSYLPACKMILQLAEKYKGDFRISISVSGLALEQFGLYMPDVIIALKELYSTGCAEFISETYSHSLASLHDSAIFREQVRLNEEKLEELFGCKPRVFRNTEMIYSDKIGAQVAAMGYEAMLTEGAQHILGWKSPGYIYVNAINPRLKVLMRNFNLSDDIAFRFSDQGWDKYPLTAEKFIGWIDKMSKKEEVVNLFLSMEALGGRQPKESGIFGFFEKIVEKTILHPGLKFATPTEIIEDLQPVSSVSVPVPISWADDERDLTAWLGNGMQKEAFDKLFGLCSKIEGCSDTVLLNDWNYLQASDHFYYMSTKNFSDGKGHKYFNPFESPYEAFINYMNVLSDFINRLNLTVSASETENQIHSLQKIITEKDLKIRKLEATLTELRRQNNSKTKRAGNKKE